MKKMLIILISLFLISSLFAKVSFKQDNKNKKYLNLLDDNLVQTIRMIDAFNRVANKIPSKVKGLGRYRRFLMDITIETGRLRDQIKVALKKDKEPELREILLRDMIISLKSDTKFTTSKISQEQDNYNYHFLEDTQKIYNKRLKVIRKKIFQEEKNIIDKGEFTPTYFKLQSENYLYSLILNFTTIQDYLSKNNRQTLVDVVKSVEASATE